MYKILLVDDDKATNFYNHYVLKKSHVDCSVVMLDNGLKALEYIKNIDVPDIIFLDVNMPIMDGIQFLEAVQKWSSGILEKIKVIVMVSVDLTQDRKEKLNAVAHNVKIIKGKMLTESKLLNFL